MQNQTAAEAKADKDQDLLQNIFSFFSSTFVDKNVGQIKTGLDQLGKDLEIKLDESSEGIKTKIQTLLTDVMGYVTRLAIAIPTLINELFSFLSENLGKLFQYLTGSAPDQASPAAN